LEVDKCEGRDGLVDRFLVPKSHDHACEAGALGHRVETTAEFRDDIADGLPIADFAGRQQRLELGVDKDWQRHDEVRKVRRELQHVIDVVRRSSVRPQGDKCGGRIVDRTSEEGPVGGVRRRPAR